MSEKTKKILMIVLFVMIVIGLALLLYFIFFRKAPAPPVEIVPPEEEVVPFRLPITRADWEKMTIQQRAQQGLPTTEWPEETEGLALPAEIERIVPQIDDVAQGGRTWITPITDDPVKGATLSSDGVNNFYYDRESGHFYKVDGFGNKTLLTDQVFYNVENVNWAPTKDRAIIEYPDGFKVMYDFNQKKQYTLPKNWQEFSWDSTGSKVVFKSMSQYAENTWLAVARPDGSQAEPIEHMGDNADKVVVSWSPNNQVVAFSATGQPRGAWEQEILLIGQYQENFKSLVVDGRDFRPKWSPQGDKIVYSVYSSDSDYQPRLYLVNAQGDTVGNDKINLGLITWADKCAFDSVGDFLYCAVPEVLPEGSGLVTELADNTRDDFYKIDTSTGHVTFLAEGAMGGYNVQDIYLSADDQYLYFVDKNTERLRSIKLK